MKFLHSDFLVVGIGMAVIATFSFLYYKDVTTKVQAGNNELVGIVTYKRKTAERKYAGQVIWEGVDNNIPLYNYDSIRTSDQSEATLHLNDGTEIKLNENSMILLALTKNQIDIQFDQGSITANRGDAKGEVKKLNIKSGSTNVSIDKSNVKLSQNKSGDLNLSVAKGNADISTGKGAEKVGTDQALVVAKDSGDVIKFELAVKLVNPFADEYLLAPSEKRKVDFSWLAVKGEHSVFFELSGDESFANIIQKKEIKGNSFSLELDKGIYYWRIRAVHRITKKEEFSELRRFTVLWDEPINLISPLNKEIISYRNTLPIINFKWTKSEIASGYRLVLASDAAMEKIIKTFDTPQNNLALDTLSKGIYYWRIEKSTGLKDIGKTNPSGIFELSVNEKEVTAPPELLYPRNAKQFSKAVLEKQNITFTWKNIPDIHEYRFSVARDEAFKDAVFTGTSKVNFLQLEKNLPKSTYYWRVAGRVDADEFTDPSKARMFSVIDAEEVRLVVPAKNAVLNVEENERSASVRFSWDASEIKGNYRALVSKSDDFSSTYKESIVKSPSTGTAMQIEPGKYYWKVVVIDNDDSILADSQPQFFSVQNSLDAPVVISPKNGYTVNMSDKNILSLNWNKVEGASIYRVSVYQMIKGKEYKIADIEEKGTGCKITDLHKLDESTFSWTLQAFEISANKKEIVRKSQLIKSNFKITLGKPVEKVNVKSLKIENL
jgi:hypothetical protein